MEGHGFRGRGFQAKLKVEAMGLAFRAYRVCAKRDQLQQEVDDIMAAGDVQIIGVLENGGPGDQVLLDILVENWGPAPE